MRLGNRKRLTSWHKYRLTSAILCGAMLAVALFIIVLVSALIDNERLTRLTWLSFSAFPLLGVVVISWLARVQKQFYLRGSGQREHS